MSDTIIHDGDRWFLPSEPASIPGYVKHAVCEGSREHVLSWSLMRGPKGDAAIEHCSEPRCICNKIAADDMKRIGLKPSN